MLKDADAASLLWAVQWQTAERPPLKLVGVGLRKLTAVATQKQASWFSSFGPGLSLEIKPDIAVRTGKTAGMQGLRQTGRVGREVAVHLATDRGGSAAAGRPDDICRPAAAAALGCVTPQQLHTLRCHAAKASRSCLLLIAFSLT